MFFFLTKSLWQLQTSSWEQILTDRNLPAHCVNPACRCMGAKNIAFRVLGSRYRISYFYADKPWWRGWRVRCSRSLRPSWPSSCRARQRSRGTANSSGTPATSWCWWTGCWGVECYGILHFNLKFKFYFVIWELLITLHGWGSCSCLFSR